METSKTLEERVARAKAVRELKESGWKVLGFVLLFPVTVWSGGYVGAQLWNWFTVPVLHVAAMTVSQSIALAFVITYFFKTTPPLDKEKKFWQTMFGSLARPWAVLGIAWIVKKFLTL